MPIGEFGGAPPLVAEGSPALTTPMYWMYEMGHASLNPARAVTDVASETINTIAFSLASIIGSVLLLVTIDIWMALALYSLSMLRGTRR